MLIRPRLVVVLCALVIEGVALLWWPTVHLLDASGAVSRLSEMFLQRYPLLGEIANALKSVIDWVFPGALWSWDGIVNFVTHTLMVATAAYAVAAWRVADTPVPARWVFGPLVVFQISLMLVPGSLTTDIFNYAIYGQMPVLYGANPFVHTPSEFPQNPLYYVIPLYWHDAPSVYGPFWILISMAVAALFRPLPLADELLFYRLIANVAHLANAWLIWSIARRIDLSGKRAASAALAYGWNPFLLLDFALNGHNDVFMLTLTLAAFWLATSRRPYPSALLLALSVATKYTSVLVAPVLIMWSARQATPAWNARRWGMLTISGLIVVGTLTALYAPWVQGIDTFGPVLYWASGPRLQNFWPEPTLIAVTTWTAALLNVPYEDVWEPLLGAFKLAARVFFVCYVLLEGWRARSFDNVLAASARIMIVFLLLVNTWVMPWYYTWPLALAAPLGWGSMVVRMCAGLTLTAPIMMYQRQFQYGTIDERAGLFLVSPIVIAAVAQGIRWARSRARAPGGSLARYDVVPSR